jgi:hypothetical protein
MSEKIIRGLYMDSSTWNTLDDESKKEDRSTNWMINKIIKEWIENNKTKDKKARAKGR